MQTPSFVKKWSIALQDLQRLLPVAFLASCELFRYVAWKSDRGVMRVSVDIDKREPSPTRWTRRHLLGLEELSQAELVQLLDTAEGFVAASRRQGEKRNDLKGRTVVTLFFEPSTRTRASFGFAARRLGAETSDFAATTSSLNKGETFIDTARNIEAMGVDLVIVRHSVPGAPICSRQHLNCHVVNAGDGRRAPTQGLLDIFTIRQLKGRIEGLTVGLVGDIAHSRVAAVTSTD
jgi:aspartate carbamoyltransferase catalytic subunit